jgi:hypothetical protein
MLVLAFTALLLFALTAAGALTDRWAAHISDSTPTHRPGATITTVAARRAPRDVARTRRHGPPRTDIGTLRWAGHVAVRSDPTRLVLLDSQDDANSAARQAARRHHPAGRSSVSGELPSTAIFDRVRPGAPPFLRPEPPTNRRSA